MFIVYLLIGLFWGWFFFSPSTPAQSAPKAPEATKYGMLAAALLRDIKERPGRWILENSYESPPKGSYPFLIRREGCDVILIASDEGFFVHRPIFIQGFSEAENKEISTAIRELIAIPSVRVEFEKGGIA